MAILKTVGVKELKNNLSAYIREVKRGARIFVSDRSVIVAELHEPMTLPITPDVKNELLVKWVESGILRLPLEEKKKLKPSGIKVQPGTSLQLLNQDREEWE